MAARPAAVGAGAVAALLAMTSATWFSPSASTPTSTPRGTLFAATSTRRPRPDLGLLLLARLDSCSSSPSCCAAGRPTCVTASRRGPRPCWRSSRWPSPWSRCTTSARSAPSTMLDARHGPLAEPRRRRMACLHGVLAHGGRRLCRRHRPAGAARPRQGPRSPDRPGRSGRSGYDEPVPKSLAAGRPDARDLPARRP